MIYNNEINDLKKLLFLILFFKVDGFAFRYPMNVFFNKKLEEAEILSYWREYNKSTEKLQLYIHNIFCDTRCSYCDCESFVKGNNEDFLFYKEYIFSEIKKYGKVINKKLNSIYFGGGTFNLFSDEEIEDYCKLIKGNFVFSSDLVWQVEIHSYYIQENTLEILKKYGVTDLMIGIQTASEKVNKLNNRKFSKEKLDKVISEIKKLGFKKISFDLMYNVPYMTEKDLLSDLECIIQIGSTLKNSGISVNMEINRWDISLKTTFANLILKKYGKENFFETFKYFFKSSKKFVKIIDNYIDKYFLGLFDTNRDEIEERKALNTAILGIGISSTSYIPGVVAYENNSIEFEKEKNSYLGYDLEDNDNDLFLLSNNLRRGVCDEIFNNALNNSGKFKDYFEYYKEYFTKNKEQKVFMDIKTDIENDLLNLFLVKDEIRKVKHEFLKNKWLNLGFSFEDLEKYYNMFLEYYYNRNKLYG